MTIPNGWKEVKLGDISIISSGFTFKRRYQGFSGLKWNYFKVLDIGLPSNHKYLRTAVNTVDDSMVAEIKCVPFERGSIVFPRVGAALKNNNKKILAQDSIVDDNTLAVTVHNDNYSNEYVYYWLETIDLAELCNDGTVPVLGARKIGEIDIPFPPLPEQQKIARILCAWDAAIEKTENLVAEKERAYSAILNKSIRINFCGERKLENSLEEISVRNKNTHIERVLSVSNINGFVLSEEQFGKRVASSDLSNYKIVLNGEFAYNPSRINVGSISRLDTWENGVVSPMYVVFKITDKLIDSNFFLHWLNSNQAKHRIKNSAQGSVRETVSFIDFSRIRFPKISIEHQRLIGNYLTSAKKEIALLRSLAGEYRRQKQWLMQKLLTGSLRVK